MAQYILLKILPPILVGMGNLYLNRTKVRTSNGWLTVPDEKLFAKVC